MQGSPRLSDILDAGFRVYRTHFWPLAGLSLLATVPMLLSSTLITQLFLPMLRNSSVALFGLQIWLLNLISGYVLSLLFRLPQQAVLNAALVPALGGEWVGTGNALRTGVRAWPRLLLAALGPLAIAQLLGGVSSLFFTPLVSLAYTGDISSVTTNILFLCLGIAIALPLWLLLSALYGQLMLYIPAIVIEQRGAAAALARSWELTRGGRIPATLLVILEQLLLYILTTLPSLLLTFAVFRLNLDRSLLSVVGIGTALLGQTVIAPLGSAFLAALYVALRNQRQPATFERDVMQWAGE